MKTASARRALAILLVAAGSAMAGEIWVSPGGDDSAPGTRERPLASPHGAREVARAQIKAGQGVEIILRGGNYELPAPLELGAGDSGTRQAPVVWRAANGEDVRLGAGRTVAGWRLISDAAVRERLDPAVRDRVLELDLKGLGITDYGTMSGGFGKAGNAGLELFVDDAPTSISRYPDDGFIAISEVLGPTEVNVRGIRGRMEGIFRAGDGRVSRWAEEKAPMAMGYWFWDWADERQAIASIDPGNATLTLAGPGHTYGYRKGQYFYGFNLLCEIDHPGEWYLDRKTGRIYLLPQEKETPRRTMVSRLPSVVTFKKAANISLRGLVLEGARDHAVNVTDCDGIEVAGCTIRNSGKWGVRVAGGSHCAVRGCEISGTGDGGVSLSGGDRATLTPCGHTVENCRIHNYSRWDRTYQPGISLNGVGCRAAHNLIHDAPHQAMNFAGNDHLIEFNEIHSVCQETNDAGAIYGWNDWAARGHRIRYNYLHEISGLHGKGANGIYLDDNFSAATIEGNIFRGVERAVHLGGGRDHQVLNNLFVDCRKALHIDARGMGWRAFGFDELKKKLELWPYRSEPWSARYPQLLTLLSDEPMAPKGIVVARNIFVDCPSWNDIEPKAKPFVTMTDNLFDAPRTLLAAGGGIPRINLQAPEVRAIQFAPIPTDHIGLLKKPAGAVKRPENR